jgi:hypothetical protein
VTTAAYIGRLLELLVHDSALDEEMARCADSLKADQVQYSCGNVGDIIRSNFRQK